MKEPVISIAMDAEGLWQAVGHFLGHDVAIKTSSLWDCLEACKQTIWDIEVSHDAAAGRLYPSRLEAVLPNNDDVDLPDLHSGTPHCSAREDLDFGLLSPLDRSDRKP